MDNTALERRAALAVRAQELTYVNGTGVKGKATSILAMMAEFGISDRSAIGWLTQARRMKTRKPTTLPEVSLTKKERRLPDLILCECGKPAHWRADVTLGMEAKGRSQTASLFMCDSCRIGFREKIEPITVTLTTRQYADLLELPRNPQDGR